MKYSTKNNTPLIDIILLTYNNINNTIRCIDNIYRFTDDFGLIILDNNSTDGTVEYLQSISSQNNNITLSFSETNLGIVKGRNRAYKLSKGAKYIFVLDNDQFVSEGWWESYLFLIEQGFDLIGAEGWKMRKDFYPFRKVEKGESYSYVGCGGMVIKRKVIDDIGLFDEVFNPAYFEDPDFCWRAYLKGYKICWNVEKKIYHKPHKLLNNERRIYFNKSWHEFSNKWREQKLIELKNPQIKC